MSKFLLAAIATLCMASGVFAHGHVSGFRGVNVGVVFPRTVSSYFRTGYVNNFGFVGAGSYGCNVAPATAFAYPAVTSYSYVPPVQTVVMQQPCPVQIQTYTQPAPVQQTYVQPAPVQQSYVQAPPVQQTYVQPAPAVVQAPAVYADFCPTTFVGASSYGVGTGFYGSGFVGSNFYGRNYGFAGSNFYGTRAGFVGGRTFFGSGVGAKQKVVTRQVIRTKTRTR